MPKIYTVVPPVLVLGAHRAAPLADSIPAALAATGQKIPLNTEAPQNVHVAGAGNDDTIDFTEDDFIYTTGLHQCIAVCAVWNKVGGVFTDGYLAHVSSPHNARIAGNLPAVPPGAWVVVSVGPGAWPAAIGAALCGVGGRPHNNVWIYVRAAGGNSGFGIDKYGRFGEV